MTKVKETIEALLEQQGSVSVGEAIKATGVTRQAVYYHLRRMVEEGLLLPEGEGRGRRYRRKALFTQRFAREGLQEDIVWKSLLTEVDELKSLSEESLAIAGYAFTEMLNNAIDHSRSGTVDVSVEPSLPSYAFSIHDQGIGIFRNVREKLSLANDLEALQQISKGKTTTDPERHSGQGIFFTSKAVDVFTLMSGSLRWTVDNLRDDQAVGSVPVRKGTLVRFEIGPETRRSLSDVFDAYSDPDDYRFNKSRIELRLFDTDVRFVSRSEAKRLARNLEKFEEVVIDFGGVKEVGQGFVDELFRVWQADHPQVKLIPVNMDPVVAFMVERGTPVNGQEP